jgi:hypothetical protein
VATMAEQAGSGIPAREWGCIMLNLQELERLNPELDEESALRQKGAGNPLQLMMIQQICQGRPVDPAAGFPKLFRDECVKGSGIDPVLYDSAVALVEDSGRWETHEALNWKVSRNWQNKPHDFRMLAGFYGEDGVLWQAKPLNPRTKENGSIQKYESPMGAGSTAYLPPVPAEIRQRIAARYGIEEPSEHLKKLYASQGKEAPSILNGSFREWLQQKPSIPIVLTEGGKKGLSVLSLGYVGIALYGVNGGYRSNEKIAGETIPLDRARLIDSLQPFIVEGRPIILAFDQDAESKTRQKVTAALFKFAVLLKSHGAKVSIASWDGKLGKGIDDLQVNAGKEAVEAAISNALDFDDWAIAHRLANRVKREPSKHIGDREFVEVAAELPRAGIIALHGGKGTGKSKCIAQLVKNRPWVSVTGLIALSREQAESFGGDFINDMERGRSGYRPSGGGVAVCVPSLLKAKGFSGEVLILDETTAVLKFLLESKLANREGIRPLLLTEFERRVKEASLVILADADLTEEVIAYVEKIQSGEKAFLVRTDRKPLGWKGNFLKAPRTVAIMDLLEAAKRLESGKTLYISTDSKKLAETLSELLSQELGIKSLLITQETSGGDIERSFLQSKGADLPSLAMMGIQAIICSPSVVQGFSIEQNTHLIAGFWGFYQGASIDAVSIAQALDRVRSPIPRNIWIANKGTSYSRFSAALNQNDWLLDFHKSGTCTATVAKLSLRSNTLDKVGAIDWQSDNIKLLAHFETERNKGMFALEATVKALLQNEGKSVTTRKILDDPDEIESFEDTLKKLSERLEEERAAAVSGAQELSGDEVAALERKAQNGTLTQGEILSLERFYISKFYRLSEVKPDLVTWDKKGLTRKRIEHLEAIVIEGRALERTAASINQNPETPQDWDKSELRRMLLQVSGALPLILGIWDGTITDLKDEIIAPIAVILQKHAKEFAIAFNFRNVDGVGGRQAVFTLLDHFGIKRVSEQITRADGIRDRAYSVDNLHLANLKAVITRRSACTPPPNERDIQGGCAAPTVLEKLSQAARKTALELLDRLKSAQSPEQQRAIWYRTEENPLQGERSAWDAAWETLESTPEGQAILFNLG